MKGEGEGRGEREGEGEEERGRRGEGEGRERAKSSVGAPQVLSNRIFGYNILYIKLYKANMSYTC
jgi:hypothetical protein